MQLKKHNRKMINNALKTLQVEITYLYYARNSVYGFTIEVNYDDINKRNMVMSRMLDLKRKEYMMLGGK